MAAHLHILAAYLQMYTQHASCSYCLESYTKKIRIHYTPQFYARGLAEHLMLHTHTHTCASLSLVIRFFTRKIGYAPERDPALPYIRPSLKESGSYSKLLEEEGI